MKNNDRIILVVLLLAIAYIVLVLLNNANSYTAYTIVLESGEEVPTKTLFTETRYKHFYIQCVDNVTYFKSNSGISPMFDTDSTIKTCTLKEN